jgi:hypothetical protein
MGIYSNGSIFGIQIYNFNDDDMSNILFEEKQDEIMSYTQMREAYLFYNNLNDKNNIFFKIYTESTSTLSYNKDNFMTSDSVYKKMNDDMTMSSTKFGKELIKLLPTGWTDQEKKRLKKINGKTVVCYFGLAEIDSDIDNNSCSETESD